MTKTTQSPKRPTHAIYCVIGEGEKARWMRIGSAWANRDGKGLNLSFDAYPVAGRIVVREALADEADGGDRRHAA